MCYVNGREIKEPLELVSGSRVILGKNHVFRFTNPTQPRCETSMHEGFQSGDSQGVQSDWNYAQIELLEKQGV